MQSIESRKVIDFSVFSQVIKGHLNPSGSNKFKIKSAIQLVQKANTYIICTGVSIEEVDRKLSEIDLLSYGYNTFKDYEIIREPENNSTPHKAILQPSRIFSLKEDITLPDPPDQKSKQYLQLFSDEFERIKIRAECAMNRACSKKIISLYATRNYQVLKKLYHESRYSFNELCKNSEIRTDQSNLYIFYTLNLFIIRCLVFYTKFFKHQLKIKIENERKLRDSFHRQLPNSPKYLWYYDHCKSMYNILDFKNYTTNIKETDLGSDIKGINFDIPFRDPGTIDILKLQNSFQLNCNTNLFADMFYQLIYERQISDHPFLEADVPKLCKVLSFFFKDKNGQPLNPDSLRTMLKPSGFHKRPHKDDIRKIMIN